MRALANQQASTWMRQRSNALCVFG